jgi:hypothetical protein
MRVPNVLSSLQVRDADDPRDCDRLDLRFVRRSQMTGVGQSGVRPDKEQSSMPSWIERTETGYRVPVGGVKKLDQSVSRTWGAWRCETQRLNYLHRDTPRWRWLKRRRIMREFREWWEWGVKNAWEGGCDD